MDVVLFNVQVLLLVDNVVEVDLGLRQVPTSLQTVLVHFLFFVLFEVL